MAIYRELSQERINEIMKYEEVRYLENEIITLINRRENRDDYQDDVLDRPMGI